MFSIPMFGIQAPTILSHLDYVVSEWQNERSVIAEREASQNIRLELKLKKNFLINFLPPVFLNNFLVMFLCSVLSCDRR